MESQIEGVPLFPIGRKEYNWPETQREKKKEIPLPHMQREREKGH
jgi:hypothetical protein